MIRYVDTATENVTSIHLSRVTEFYSWASENPLHFTMHTYTRHKPLSQLEEFIYQWLVSKAESINRKRKQQRQEFREHRPLQRIPDGVCSLPLMKWRMRNQRTRLYDFKPSKQYMKRMSAWAAGFHTMRKHLAASESYSHHVGKHVQTASGPLLEKRT